jgi:hypothetical protein
MSELQDLAKAVRLLGAMAQDKIDEALLSESPDQIRRLLAEVRESVDAMVEAVEAYRSEGVRPGI